MYHVLLICRLQESFGFLSPGLQSFGVSCSNVALENRHHRNSCLWALFTILMRLTLSISQYANHDSPSFSDIQDKDPLQEFEIPVSQEIGEYGVKFVD